LAIQFTTDAIIDDFYDMKTRKVRLKWKKVSFFLSYFTKESVLWVVAKIYDYMEIYIYTHTLPTCSISFSTGPPFSCRWLRPWWQIMTNASITFMLSIGSWCAVCTPLRCLAKTESRLPEKLSTTSHVNLHVHVLQAWWVIFLLAFPLLFAAGWVTRVAMHNKFLCHIILLPKHFNDGMLTSCLLLSNNSSISFHLHTCIVCTANKQHDYVLLVYLRAIVSTIMINIYPPTL
jgi:hypothetical protein